MRKHHNLFSKDKIDKINKEVYRCKRQKSHLDQKLKPSETQQILRERQNKNRNIELQQKQTPKYIISLHHHL